MTLTYELDVDILKMYTENEVSRSRVSQVRVRNRTDTLTRTPGIERITTDAFEDGK